MSRPTTPAISPCLIVNNVDETTTFYATLGFEVTFQEPQEDPFFAVLCRNGAQLMVKSAAGIHPIPNAPRHTFSLRWDAYVYAPDPDALAAEFQSHSVTFTSPLQDTHDGLRGFELTDPNGYILFFGRPQNT